MIMNDSQGKLLTKSHKYWYTNRLISEDMIFRYYDEGSGVPVQMWDSTEPSLPAYEILELIPLSSDYLTHESLPKCADSPEFSLLV